LKNAQDQESFDHYVTKFDVMMNIRVLRQQIIARAPSAHLSWINWAFNQIEKVLDSTYILYDGKKLPWKAGILSGLRMTSLLGSLVNLEQYYATTYLLPLPTNEVAVLGDDFICRESVAGDALVRWENLTLRGYHIKQSDSTVDTSGEIVRFVVSDNSIRGYPVRAVSSLQWSDDRIAMVGGGIESMKNLLSSFALLAGRGMDYQTTKDMVLASLQRLTTHGAEWARSPRSAGGGGVWEWGVVLKAWAQIPDKYDEPSLHIHYAPDLRLKAASLGLDEHEAMRAVSRLARFDVPRTPIRGRLIPAGALSIDSVPSAPASKDRFAFQPRFITPEYRSIFFLDAVKKLAKNKQWTQIHAMLDERSRTTLKKLRLNAGVHVVMLWLTRSLPFSTPLMSRYNQALISKVHEPIARQTWDRLIITRKLKLHQITRAAVACEGATYYEILKGSYVHFTP
jgi:hypothetical protein